MVCCWELQKRMLFLERCWSVICLPALYCMDISLMYYFFSRLIILSLKNLFSALLNVYFPPLLISFYFNFFWCQPPSLSCTHTLSLFLLLPVLCHLSTMFLASKCAASLYSCGGSGCVLWSHTFSNPLCTSSHHLFLLFSFVKLLYLFPREFSLSCDDYYMLFTEVWACFSIIV